MTDTVPCRRRAMRAAEAARIPAVPTFLPEPAPFQPVPEPPPVLPLPEPAPALAAGQVEALAAAARSVSVPVVDTPNGPAYAVPAPPRRGPGRPRKVR